MFLHTEIMSKKNSKKTSKVNSPQTKDRDQFQLMSMKDKMFNTIDHRYSKFQGNSFNSKNSTNFKHRYISNKQIVKVAAVSSSLENTHRLIEEERKAINKRM